MTRACPTCGAAHEHATRQCRACAVSAAFGCAVCGSARPCVACWWSVHVGVLPGTPDRVLASSRDGERGRLTQWQDFLTATPFPVAPTASGRDLTPPKREAAGTGALALTAGALFSDTNILRRAPQLLRPVPNRSPAGNRRQRGTSHLRRHESAVIRSLILLALMAGPAAAQPVPTCGQRNMIVPEISERYGEMQRMWGLSNSGTLVEIWAGPEGWTAIEVDATGRACIRSTGKVMTMVKALRKGREM